MIFNITNHVVQNLLQAKIINQEDIAVYEFGIETLLSDVLNFITIVMAGMFMGQLWESLIFQLIFISLRSWAGGYHASSEWRCWLLSNASVLGGLLLSCHLPIWFTAGGGLGLLVACAGIIWLLAPVQNENNPLSLDEIRAYRFRVRIVVLIIVFFSVLLFYLSNSFFCIAVLAVFSVALSLIVGSCVNHSVQNV